MLFRTTKEEELADKRVLNFKHWLQYEQHFRLVSRRQRYMDCNAKRP
jgi:hypothetical protein